MEHADASLFLIPLLAVLAHLGLAMLFFVAGTEIQVAALSVGLLGATGLPIIVAVTAIGIDEGLLSTGLAAALVGAGMLSVLVFPLVAMSLRGAVPATTALEDDAA